MNKTKIIIASLAGFALFAFAGIAYAVNITVPSSPSAGYTLVSNQSGTPGNYSYVATTTQPLHVGTIFATSTVASSTFSNGINLTKGCYALNGTCLSAVGGSASSTLLSDLNTFSSLNKFTGGLIGTASSTFSNALHINQASTTNLEMTFYAQDWPGTELGAQATAAYAAAQPGDTIVVSASTTQTTPINFNTLGKVVTLKCSPGVVITSTVAATSTIFNYGDLNNLQAGGGIEGCHYKTLTAGSKVAFQVGGSNGAQGFTMRDVTVEGFHLGVGYESNSWVELMENSFFRFNDRAVHVESANNSGENMRFIANTFADCNSNVASCVRFEDDAVASAVFSGGSFDDAGLSLGDGNLSVEVDGVHFENPGEPGTGRYTYVTVATGGGTNLHFNGGTWMNGAPTITTAPWQFVLNGGHLVIDDVSLNNNTGDGHTMASAVNNYGGGTVEVYSFIDRGGGQTVTSFATSSVDWLSDTDAGVVSTQQEMHFYPFQNLTDALIVGQDFGNGITGIRAFGSAYNPLEFDGSTLLLNQDSAGNIGTDGTTTPGTIVSIGTAVNTQGINFSLATSTFTNVGGLNLTTGCFAIRGTCLSTSGGSSFSYPFPLLGLATTAPIMLLASTTIGDGTVAGGLTVSGGATTTKNSSFLASLNVGTSTFNNAALNVQGTAGTVNDTGMFRYQDSSRNGCGQGYNTTNNFGWEYCSSIGSSGRGFGIFSSTANTALPQLFVATSGRVGLGSTTPDGKLSIQANAGDTNPILFEIGSSTATATTTLLSVSNTGNTIIQDVFTSFNSQPMLSVSENSSTDTGTTTFIYDGGSGAALQINDSLNDQTPLTVDSSGRLGLGTSTPYAELSVFEANNSTPTLAVSALNGVNTEYDQYQIGGEMFKIKTQDNKTRIISCGQGTGNCSNNGTIFFDGDDSGTITATIDNTNHRVGVATTTPTATLGVDGTVMAKLTTFAVGDFAVCQRGAGGFITFDTGVTTCAVSSQYLKNFEKNDTYDEAWARIQQVQVVEFNYKDTGVEDIGAFAEAMSKIDHRYAQYETGTETISGHTFHPGDAKAINWTAVQSDMIVVIQHQSAGNVPTSSKWPYVVIVVVVLGFCYQQVQIRTLKKYE